MTAQILAISGAVADSGVVRLEAQLDITHAIFAHTDAVAARVTAEIAAERAITPDEAKSLAVAFSAAMDAEKDALRNMLKLMRDHIEAEVRRRLGPIPANFGEVRS